MPSVTIPDETFRRLAQRAAALNVTVEQLLAPLLDLATKTMQPAQSSAASLDDLRIRFDTWMADVQKRASRYPPGFQLDSTYQCCGE